MGKSSSIKLPSDLVDKLRALKKSHQAIAGVVEDLINAQDFDAIILSPELLSKLGEYRTHPRETVEDLIKSVLDELESNLNNIGGSK